MFSNLIEKKFNGNELTQTEYYEAVDKLLRTGANKDAIKFFLSLNSFGMTLKEVLFLTKAIRDSGKVLYWDECVVEKHSTGGIGDATSVVLVPLMASLGYKIIKTTTKSFMFTNGSADRFGAIPGFSVSMGEEDIKNTLSKNNACVLTHDEMMCPADKVVQELREVCGLEEDLNLLAASIASKKLASGAKVVLVDVKYGSAAIIPNLSKAKKLAKILKYVFKQCGVECVVVITDTAQTIGEGVGNAVEVVDALNVLQGRHCKLRDVAVEYVVEMILKVNKNLQRKDVYDMACAALDNGSAYNQFLRIVKAQGGDAKIVKESKLLKPHKSVNFVADRNGYVGSINSLLLGELIRRLCVESHDNHIGAVLRVKIGDYVKSGDIIVSFYYKDQEDFEKYRNAIAGCVRLTNEVMKPVDVIKKVIR